MYKKNVANQSIMFSLINSMTGAALPGAIVTTLYTIDHTGAQQVGAGVMTGLGNGQYRYVPPASETNGNHIGFLFTAPGAIPVHCNVTTTWIFPAGSINFTYTLTNVVTGLPINGADIWISTDIAGANIIWSGSTDVFGVARDVFGSIPSLDPGVYFFWRHHPSFTFTDPDSELVS